LLVLALGVVVATGCQRRTVETFESSKAVQALAKNGESDEERALWADLQQQIRATLAKLCGTPTQPKLLGEEDADRLRLARLQHGAQVYARRCQECHGVNGDGRGSAAVYLHPRPRDYTQGIFKFTSTPSGARPRRADLMATLRRGVTGASMPSFSDLPDEDLEAVTDYVIALAMRGQLESQLVMIADEEEELDDEYVAEVIEEIVAAWREAEDQVVMPVVPMPPMTAETVAQGQAWFLKQACNKCHGKDGRGGSLGNVEVGRDVWGMQAAAADLTSGMFHGGGTPLDLYRRIYSGINGSPMPGFGEIYREHPETVWHLVHFVKALGERRRQNEPPLTPQEIAEVEARVDELTAVEGSE
jgi:mono/diheme cytochrome c family protein